ncbi:MAG: GTP-binding protein [Halofilum sp. (in: g-proteobacteria)]|nr:GTP-binding protein [Halofilum sp. (in: g-proteobacteria)]
MALVADESIPVIVALGFLGSGKTTLIRRLLADPQLHDTAVIVNEFGEVGLDHALVESSEEDTVLLAGGCLCCASQANLVRALRSLLERRERRELPHYRRVIVETSGLADPVPLLQTFLVDPLRLSLYRLQSVVTLVDALSGEATLERHALARRQVAMADRLFLTKCDLAAEGERAPIRERLQARAAAARAGAIGRRAHRDHQRRRHVWADAGHVAGPPARGRRLRLHRAPVSRASRIRTHCRVARDYLRRRR